MDRDTLEFILSALPGGRTVFYDYPDHFAILLLEHALGGEDAAVSDLKTSRFAPLLNKQRVKEVLSRIGRTRLAAKDFEYAGPPFQEAYRMTAGTWPSLDEKPRSRWNQTTRPGWGLVLQMNVTASHRRSLAEKVPAWRSARRYGHPISTDDELTLAWARIDLDLGTNEALIEEIQSDWVRDVQRYARRFGDGESGNWKSYLYSVLRRELKCWQETMMTATLWFLLEEIGIRTIFYHTHETGTKLKHIDWSAPPRSIYTDLPRRFCFEITHNGPRFIRDTAGRRLRALFTEPDTRWWIHDFSANWR